MNGHIETLTIATRTLAQDSNCLTFIELGAAVQTPRYRNLEPKVPWNEATQLTWMEFLFGKGIKKCFRGDTEGLRFNRWTLSKPPPSTITILLFLHGIYGPNASCVDPLTNRMNRHTMEEKNVFTFPLAKGKKADPRELATIRGWPSVHGMRACPCRLGQVDTKIALILGCTNLWKWTCTSIHLCRHTTLNTKVDVR